MFSFGPIKTATALGGALFSFRGDELCAGTRLAQQRHPVQSSGAFLRRVAKYALLKLLSYRAAYSLFGVLCRLLGTTHDAVVGRALRGFAGGDFFVKIRRQPSAPLLALLERRVRSYTSAHVQRRVDAAAAALALIPRSGRVGASARHHTHWVFPILSSRPKLLVRHLWRQGFDGTRGASSLYALPTASVAEALDHVVYLPVYAGLSTASVCRLMETVTRFEAAIEGRLPPG
jgi:dTDP-4-amino-4,6-dideoxygalactose transaminase